MNKKDLNYLVNFLVKRNYQKMYVKNTDEQVVLLIGNADVFLEDIIMECIYKLDIDFEEVKINELEIYPIAEVIIKF